MTLGIADYDKNKKIRNAYCKIPIASSSSHLKIITQEIRISDMQKYVA